MPAEQDQVTPKHRYTNLNTTFQILVEKYNYSFGNNKNKNKMFNGASNYMVSK
jgi:hypothetical protein